MANYTSIYTCAEIDEGIGDALSWGGGRVLVVDATIDQGDSSITRTIAWHIADASGAKTTVSVLVGTYKISTDITVPSTMMLDIKIGGIFKPDSGKTLTVYSPQHIIASPRQIVDITNNSTNPLEFTIGGTVYPEWWGAKGDASTDDKAALQMALNAGKIVVLNRVKRYVVSSANLLMPDFTSLIGEYEHTSTSQKNYYADFGSAIHLSSSYSIYLRNGCQIKGVLILRHGVTGIVSDGESSFAGTALIVDEADVYIGYSSIMGFEYAIYNDGSTNRPRAKIEHNMIDSTHGITLGNAHDITRILYNHIWPFMNTTVGDNHLRTGNGIKLHDVHDWAKLTGNFVYGHAISYLFDNVNSIQSIGDGSDSVGYASITPPRTNVGFSITGTSTEIQLVDPQVASADVAISINISDGNKVLIDHPALWANESTYISVFGGDVDIYGGWLRKSGTSTPDGIVVNNANSAVRFTGTSFTNLTNNIVETAGSISYIGSPSGLKSISANNDNIDIFGIGVVVVDTNSGNVTIGGLTGGLRGQTLQIIKVASGNDLIIEDREGVGTQDIVTNDGADITLSTYGGCNLVYSGVYWFVVSE